MRNDFGTRPYKVRFPYKKRAKKSSGGKSQGYKAREDESISARLGKESTKSQSFAARRDLPCDDRCLLNSRLPSFKQLIHL